MRASMGGKGAARVVGRRVVGQHCGKLQQKTRIWLAKAALSLGEKEREEKKKRREEKSRAERENNWHESSRQGRLVCVMLLLLFVGVRRCGRAWRERKREVALLEDRGGLLLISSREYGLFAGEWRCQVCFVTRKKGKREIKKKKGRKRIRGRGDQGLQLMVGGWMKCQLPQRRNHCPWQLAIGSWR